MLLRSLSRYFSTRVILTYLLTIHWWAATASPRDITKRVGESVSSYKQFVPASFFSETVIGSNSGYT